MATKMEQITFEIPSPPQMSVEERNKLVRQAADGGFIIFFKYFIPLFFVRYWTTRFYVGALIWHFLLNWFGAYAFLLSMEKTTICAKGGECDAEYVQIGNTFGVLMATGAFVMVGVSANSSSKRARSRLGIDRKTALAILPAINNMGAPDPKI